MKVISGDLLKNVDSGIIMHQVNCQNAFGAGFAKAVLKQYPKVKESYHEIFKKYSKEELFGRIQQVIINDDLEFWNSFTQFKYGNSKFTRVKYTDEQKLIHNLLKLDEYANKKEVQAFIPYGIGCGLAGGDWNTISEAIKDTNIIIYKL